MLIRYIPRATSPDQRLRRLVRAVLYLPTRARLFLDPAYPWINAGAVRFLRSRLHPDMRGLEFGGGRSTAFFSRRVASLVTVEHDAKWRRKVAALLHRFKAKNVTLAFLPPGATATGRIPRPDIWESLGVTPRRPEFAAYFDHILSYPDEHFDFVLVDGRARVECALNALAKIRPGGWLILDNSEWEKYAPIFQAVAAWKRLDFENGVWRTTIFLKPAPIAQAAPSGHPPRSGFPPRPLAP
ncbi:class I SAM-dependent methyltransferase [Desulfolutivibrio sulfoxidireducens]|uniref:class I SAM-dependent methyltransferase n=1 Tax=Desulfolutivibrio sulfoxidireducens TaxID=2773299 RepID=UPI001FE7436F|nr:class I SAM-dependent methyltransferase [Desulfolutivibrio sulfoxidireducens]